jgi:hypothetical protein
VAPCSTAIVVGAAAAAAEPRNPTLVARIAVARIAVARIAVARVAVARIAVARIAVSNFTISVTIKSSALRVPAATFLLQLPFLLQAGEHPVEVVLLDPHLRGQLGDRDARCSPHER